MTHLPGGNGPTRAAAISCTNVSVEFGDFRALDDVTIGWAPGSVNVVVGQNGAGKTTLARVLGGLQHPSTGSIELAGEPLAAGDVLRARRRGVELVHQHFALPASFTVAEALELFSAEPRRFGSFGRRALHQNAQALLDQGHVGVPSMARVGDLPVETLQALEITRALSSSPGVLVLDEPTAVLSPPAVAALFDRVRALAATGICVVLVLHKLDEVMAVAETVAVLRSGSLVVPPTPIEATDARELARAVVGGAVRAGATRPQRPDDPTPRLHVQALQAQTRSHDAPVRDVDLSVASGEVVGIAGVEGNGQRSLVEAIAGIAPIDAGTVHLDGADLTSRPVRVRRDAGLRVVPFERNTEGISRTSALWENHALLAPVDASRTLRPSEEKAACRDALERWDVKFRTVDQQAGELSGGNVQKTILARELSGRLRCLVAAHPTRGLDIDATEAVRGAVADAANDGAAVLLVSADLDELFQLSHRLVVLSGGRVAAQFEPPYDIEKVGWAMTGGGQS